MENTNNFRQTLNQIRFQCYKKAVKKINKALHLNDPRNKLMIWLDHPDAELKFNNADSHQLFLILECVSYEIYKDLPSAQQVRLTDSQWCSGYYKKLAGFDELDPLFKHLFYWS